MKRKGQLILCQREGGDGMKEIGGGTQGENVADRGRN